MVVVRRPILTARLKFILCSLTNSKDTKILAYESFMFLDLAKMNMLKD